jgi:single-strand DNA-binding protein
MKSITIAGNIGKDAVTRTTQGGDKVTGFSVAVEERRGQDKRTIWFDCAIWGARGDALSAYLTKGTKVAVSGDLSTREHEGKTYLTVRASEVTLMGGGQPLDRAPRRDDPPARAGSGGGYASASDMDDEIPF